MRERSLQIQKRERERGGGGEGCSVRLCARDDAAAHQSGQASMLSRDHSAVPHQTRRDGKTSKRIVMQIPSPVSHRSKQGEVGRGDGVHRMIN